MTLTLSDIRVRYRWPVLNHVSAQFKPGQVHLIMGENGSGKSTLLRAIAGLVPVVSGVISLNDRTLSDWGLAWYDQVAWVPDSPPVSPDLTVLEMIELGQVFRQVSPSDRWAAIEAMGLQAVSDTPSGQVSLGYRQRVSIALATVGQWSVVVMDEPTQAVDADTIGRIQVAIRRWAQSGTTVVIASHDAALIPYSDAVYRLVNGQLVLEQSA